MKQIRPYIIAAVVLIVSITTLSRASCAATPAGFSTVDIPLNAVVEIACQEVQQGSFPSPMVIDTQSASEQTFNAITDEKIVCTNGTVFTVKVTSLNGTAMNQTCTSSGVSSMALRSSASPSDTIPYTFFCSGDTDGLGNFTGRGSSLPMALGMGVKIAAADAQAAKVHADYNDTVTMMISY